MLPGLSPPRVPAMKAPELLHLDDAAYGQANGFGVRADAEGRPRLVDGWRDETSSRRQISGEAETQIASNCKVKWVAEVSPSGITK